MSKLDIIGGAYEESSLTINAQRCVNMYVNISNPQEGSISAKQLLPTPGLKQMIDCSGVEVRGMITHSNRLFAVVDTTFYELTYDSVTDSMTKTSRGTLNNSSGRLSIDINETQIFIADGDNLEAYTFTVATNTFAEVTDGDFEGATTVTYIDGYFMYNTPNNITMFATALGDGSSVNALDVASMEARPDKSVAVKALNDELWAFGESSIEVWYNAANPVGFPFSPKSNIVLDVGCAAPHAVAAYKNAIYWFDSDGVVYTASGYEAVVISTKAITRDIEGYSTVSDAFAYCYSENGHFFYVLTFPTEKKTWVYDIGMNVWHERNYRDNLGVFTRHRSNCHAPLGRRQFVGDFKSGIIYRMSSDLYDDAGDEIQRLRTTRHGNFDNYPITIYNLELIVENGTGLVSGQGVDPQITLEFSRDAGRTWSNELSRSMGKLGEYSKQIRWNRLGTSKTFTLRFTISDPVSFAISEGTTQITVANYPDRVQK